MRTAAGNLARQLAAIAILLVAGYLVFELAVGALTAVVWLVVAVAAVVALAWAVLALR